MICKRTKIKSIITFALLAGLSFNVDSAMAQSNSGTVSKSGTAAAAFLRIPVGARGAALGSAAAATATDASAMFWNPAGIAHISEYTLLVDDAKWLPGLHFNYVGAVLPMEPIGTIGVNVTTLGTDDMDVTTVENPEGTGAKFSATSIAIGLTVARRLTDKFAIGANFKYINETIWNSTASSMAFDIGTLYTTPFDGIRFGVNIANFGAPLRMSGEDLNIQVDLDPTIGGENQSVVGEILTDSYETPLVMRVGLAWDAFQDDNNRLTVMADAINPNDNTKSVNLGAELALLKDLAFIRGGFNEFLLDEEDAEKGMTFGGGLSWKTPYGLGLKVDYAYQEFKHLPSVNRFTFALLF
ncbi:PorV/PorQ family protein [candidate division KSB1 bacterium]|nr:PorV/PorQ family protein [candidate division KSB1 bacterium]